MFYGESLICLEKYQLKEPIFIGNQKEIFKVIEKDTNKVLTAIIFPNKYFKNKNIIKNFYEQVNYKNIKHVSLLQFVGYSPIDFGGKLRHVFITEYTNNFSLNQLLTNPTSVNGENFDFTKRVIIIFGIAYGMNYLHKHKIIHKNLNTENILLDNNLYPKISGFNIPDFIHDKDTECYNDLHKDFYDNIFSFGVIIEEILREKLLDLDVNLDSYTNLIERCKSEDLSIKPNFEDIINDLETDQKFTEKADKNKFYEYIQALNTNDYKKCSIIILDIDRNNLILVA